jgi:K+-transporting ATPase KdpF subunit
MNVDDLIGLIVAIGLTAFLVIALLFPERL